MRIESVSGLLDRSRVAVAVALAAVALTAVAFVCALLFTLDSAIAQQQSPTGEAEQGQREEGAAKGDRQPREGSGQPGAAAGRSDGRDFRPSERIGVGTGVALPVDI